jgi:hypothetical protein
MMDAFRRLGHDVHTVGDAQGTLVWGMTVADKYIWKPDGEIEFTDPEWPDLVIVMDSDPHILNQVEVWAGFNANRLHAPIVCYGVDNHVREYDRPYFGHYFLAHYHGSCYPVDPTRKDHTWLPCAYDAGVFTPSPIAWADREYDVCMIGVMYPRRVEVIQALRDAGFKVRAETGLLYDEYRAAYHNSRISLCVSAAGDVAQRIFETGAMGCAILTDPLLDFGDEMTNKALHLFGRATYTNPQEAVTLAHDLLGHQPQAFQVEAAMVIESGALGEHTAKQMQANCKPHTWDARAKVIVNWFEREYGKVESVADITVKAEDVQILTDGEKMPLPDVSSIKVGTVTADGTLRASIPHVERKPFLNLGCGRVILPGERPAHHQYIPENIYQDERWVNIDRVGTVGADKVFDLFTYPWPLESNSYDGAILTHIAEHIPHEIKLAHATGYEYHELPDGSRYPKTLPDFERQKELSNLQDGFFAFFSELARVLTPGAEVHLISPYGMASDAFVDPTHTRHLFPNTFYYFVPNPDAPFEYNVGSQYEIVEQAFGFSEHAKRIMNNPQVTTEQREAGLRLAMDTQFNIVREFYVKLKVVK